MKTTSFHNYATKDICTSYVPNKKIPDGNIKELLKEKAKNEHTKLLQHNSDS